MSRLAFERSRDSLLSTRDVETGGRLRLIIPTLERFAVQDILENLRSHIL